MKSNAGANALSQVGCSDKEAPEVKWNFFNNREVSTSKLKIRKIGEMRNIPLDLVIIAEEAKTSTKYDDLIRAIREGKS